MFRGRNLWYRNRSLRSPLFLPECFYIADYAHKTILLHCDSAKYVASDPANAIDTTPDGALSNGYQMSAETVTSVMKLIGLAEDLMVQFAKAIAKRGILMVEL
jgi:hypothetical protein